MRIISGFLKSRIIKGHDIEGTRPTMDRVKESLFAMIQDKVNNSVCLDLFAGSGSLGIEAISNGASLVYFVDNNFSVIKVLKENLRNLDIENKSNVVLSDYKKALENLRNSKLDLIFLDPPYDLNLIEGILKYISKSNIMKENGCVVCEYEREILQDEYDNLVCIRSKNYGSKNVKVYVYRGIR